MQAALQGDLCLSCRCRGVGAAAGADLSFWLRWSPPAYICLPQVPDYYKIVKNPMDLGTVKTKLEHNSQRGQYRQYQNPYELLQDVRQVGNQLYLGHRCGCSCNHRCNAPSRGPSAATLLWRIGAQAVVAASS